LGYFLQIVEIGYTYHTMKYVQILFKKSPILLIAAVIVLTVSCSSSPKKSYHVKQHGQHQKILKIAKTQLGRPYRYGGLNPRTGFDCSGLIHYSYKKAGISIPRTTKQLYSASRPVKRKHLKAGDLVFFRINRRTISHVGLYIGNNKFIHAPSSGKKVNIANMNDKYWKKRFSRGGRL